MRTKGYLNIDWAPHQAAAFGDLITSQIKEYDFRSCAWIWGGVRWVVKFAWKASGDALPLSRLLVGFTA